ncbi:MAG: hypothetical protein JNK76_24640 [Planctomycetales bacterium]|nr:hypothetical protein [Planctomycetales bacterium]MBN8626598.1 hypothetical protein [Planctomycetota bacterium]
MGARSKLNQAYLNGALVVAGVCGTLFQSWGVFAVALVALLGASLRNRDIRTDDRRRR